MIQRGGVLSKFTKRGEVIGDSVKKDNFVFVEKKIHSRTNTIKTRKRHSVPGRMGR